MFKSLSLFTKYPYTAGIIALIWLATAALAAIDPALPLVKMATIDVVFSTFVAAIGFRGSR